MPPAWRLQDARYRFGEVVAEALQSGPHTVTRRGEPVLVVVAIGTWRRVTGPAPRFEAFRRSAPLEGVDLPRDVGERPGVVLPRRCSTPAWCRSWPGLRRTEGSWPGWTRWMTTNCGARCSRCHGPRRREILEILRGGPLAAVEPADRVDVRQLAVSQHLDVPEHAGLVEARREGTRHIPAGRPEGFAPLASSPWATSPPS